MLFVAEVGENLNALIQKQEKENQDVVFKNLNGTVESGNSLDHSQWGSVMCQAE